MTKLSQDVIYTSDPKAGYLSLRDEIDAAISAILNQSQYVLGDVVEHFERAFAGYVGVPHGVGVNSGTDAIHLALRGLGIGQGDEVITVSFTSVATVAAIEMSGAAPVLVDVDARWRTIDPAAVEAAIGPRTRAVIAVHLYGQPSDLGALRKLCDRHGLSLVEDCAQSHGAQWEGKAAGSFGAAACFSFYPSKNLGSVGDGGMIVTADAALANRLRLLRQYGWDKPQHSVIPGWNSRLGPLQAAILGVKLKHLTQMNERRRDVASRYGTALADLPLELPEERNGSHHVYHLYAVRTSDSGVRGPLLKHLADLGIMAGVHYPSGVHAQPAYAGRVRTLALKETEALSGTILSLPLYPELTLQQQSRVIDAVRSFFDR